jgi:LuxR family maltose regulon positive regulatory protein
VVAWFGVLGPLIVDRAGLAPPRGRLQTLLAALLVHADEVIGAPVLARLIWREDPPADPRNAVQVLVGRLRRGLDLGADPAEPPALITRDGGYRLVLDEACFDLALLARLVADAGRNGEPGARRALVERAAGLWRGEPFAVAEFGEDDPAVAGARQRARKLRRELEKLQYAAESPGPLGSGGALPVPTKVRRPQVRDDAAVRERVVAEIGACATRAQVVLISAPAGYGKSTALAQWAAAQQPGTVGWVSLDSGDNDPPRFWLHVAHALRLPADTGLGAAQPGSRQHLDAMLAALDRREGRFRLVLDDYHVIDNGALRAQLAEVLDELPAGVGVLVGSRVAAGLPIARLRAARRLCQVDREILRFTRDEAGELLGRGFGVDIGGDRLFHTVRLTEGWAAGLCLLGLALRDRPGGDTDDLALRGRAHFQQYLDGEVLDRLPPRLLSFLLATCPLERLCPSLCDAVTGLGQGAELLAELDELNLFLIEVNRDAGWFRYHHLFAEVLRERLRHDDPGLVRTLHRRAAAWYAAHGCPDDAIPHALAGGDHATAAGLIGAEFTARYQAGELLTLATWMRALPDPVLTVDMGLNVGGILLFHNLSDPPERERWTAAGHAMPMPERVRRSWVALKNTVRAHETGDVTASLRYGSETLRLGPPAGLADPGWWHTASRATLARALFFAGRPAEARMEIAAGEESSGGHLTHQVILSALRGLVAARQGRTEEAAACATAAGEVLAGLQTTGLVRLTTEAGLVEAMVLLDAGRAAEAAELLRGIVAAPAWPHPDLPVRGLTTALRCRAALLCGDLAGARERLAELTALHARCTGATLLADLRGELARAIPADGPAAVQPLTERERAVLRLLRSRLTVTQIAQELWLSPNTVKTHARSIYRKLGISSREQLRRQGLTAPAVRL